MKRVVVRSLCLALFMTVAACAVSHGQISASAYLGSSENPVSISYFEENLAPYGEWFESPSYGWCWTPYDVSADWRPYSDGHWEYTDYGWSWASNETWGWAPYHYGRWFFDDSYGWAWVPGTEWAPAWVAWRYSDDYVGWAPLPPNAGWDASSGLAYADAGMIPSQEWSFVPQTHMLDVSLRVQIISVARNVTLFGRSRDATHYEVRNGRPANFGFDVAQVERNGRRVPRRTIIDARTPGSGRGQRSGLGDVGFYRPTVRAVPPGQRYVPPVAPRQNAIPANVMQRTRVTQQRKLETDLRTERTRLARDQRSELRASRPGPAAEAVRQQHAVEQRAFDAHATQQRQVLSQRMQKQVVRPARAAVAVRPARAAVPARPVRAAVPAKPARAADAPNQGNQGRGRSGR